MIGHPNNIAFVIHGGSGRIYKEPMTIEKEKAYTEKLTEAVLSGFGILKEGGRSVDAVETAIRILEDSPLFNAGRGSVFSNDKIIELDAAIMDGKTLKAGAIAGVRTIKNPISAARVVMEKSDHVMMTAKGAEIFALENRLEIVEPAWFEIPERRQQIDQIKQAEISSQQIIEPAKYGTVGAVALDSEGNLAAGTSTGGMLNKKYGRVGDSPIIGAGTYANPVCAVSGTGWGEFFIRYTVAHDIAALMEYKKLSVAEAANTVIFDKMANAGGFGGVIALDAVGNIATTYNTGGMFWAYVKRDGKAVVNVCKMIIE